jgi:hypothetical protein
MMPSGRLIQKTQRQSAWSVNPPPSSGQRPREAEDGARVVDVGGDGELLAGILRAPSGRTGVLFENFACSDLMMLVALAAQERTEPEFRALLSSAGFEIKAVIAADVGFSIIEYVPAFG